MIGGKTETLAEAAKRLGLTEAQVIKLFGACFAAGTPLLTPTGSRVIEDFKPGDEILSRDEYDANGPVESKLVEAVFIRSALIWELRINGRVIRTTGEHPFYAREKGWVQACELKKDDMLLTLEGDWAAIEDVSDTGQFETVHNLMVADYHTYFVGNPDAWGFTVWAHNANACLADAVAAISKMSAKEQARIQDLIAKAVKQGDPGLPELVQILEGNGVRIKNVNHRIGSPLREVDVELENGIIIQVKNLSSAAKLTEQLAETAKATQQLVIGYVVQTHKKATQIVNNVNKGKQLATNDIDLLIELVK